MNLIEFLEKELKPEYKNDVFTWAQIKRGIEKYFTEMKPESEREKSIQPCKHEFVKTTGKKSKKVTWYCLHCLETREEEVRPVSKEFKIKKMKDASGW